jgi:hypothetical protein
MCYLDVPDISSICFYCYIRMLHNFRDVFPSSSWWFFCWCSQGKLHVWTEPPREGRGGCLGHVCEQGSGGGVAYVNKRVSMRHVGGQMRRPTFLQGIRRLRQLIKRLPRRPTLAPGSDVRALALPNYKTPRNPKTAHLRHLSPPKPTCFFLSFS